MEDSQHSDDYVSSDAFDFDSIPAALRTWLALQDGLKIQGQPLNSRESLELVFSLLHRSPDPHIKQIPAGFLASSVAISYVRKMMQPQSQSKKDKFIPAEPGQVVRFKCNGCNQPALDNAFAFVPVESPHRCVTEVLEYGLANSDFGCGRGGCQRCRSLSPVQPKEHRFAHMFRVGKDLKNCAQTVLIRCKGSGVDNEKIACGREKPYETPRWTIHSPPRFLIPRIRCQCDGKDHYFEPVDKTIKTISYRELEKIWNGFAKVGCNLADYPKIADYIFETKSTVSYKVRHKLLIKEKKARAEPGKTI